ncbi:PAS domain-containing sensor histidine kinase [Carboxylicivirga linearis]|uniref:histidine kinase n=1 Tax=Carboxylicivirga linearis TaxID=1628157 RepID=A0ABS5JTJ8_9BACT|nr:PAS domain-containing sensor histidine kinase [Carboxylicivirga linearis]MBS2097691.1 PAS domain S-box protein [Carboxylicivirga linearis]
MVEDNKEYSIEELKDRITDLEKQNNALSDQVEETILFNFISESFDSISNDKELIEALLEKISILKEIPVCYCIEIKSRSYKVISSYCAYDSGSNDCVEPVLKKEIIAQLQSQGVLKIKCDDVDPAVFKDKVKHKFEPYEIVLIHFHSHNVKNGVFVFVSDINNKEVFDDLFIFNQFVKIVTDKWERLGLILQLKKLNQSLERKVKARTTELTRLNNMLFQEIQTHQNTNHELNIERKKFHQLFQKANDAIYLWEIDGVASIKRCMEVNQAAIEMTGYSYDELMNMTPSDLMVKGMKGQLKPFLEKLEVNKTSKIEVIHQRKDGTTFPVEVNSHLFTLDDKKVILSIARNISEWKKIELDLIDAKEQAEESDRLKSSFLANMSHEIRTPLNAICGFTELIKEDNLEMSEVKDFADIILNNSSHLLNLINDLVDFSKIEAGYVKPTFMPVNISHLLRNLELNVQSLLYNFNKEHIKIIIDSAEELEEKLVLTDEVQLRQILSNLLNNSVKYTRKGSITLKTSIVKDQLQFIISDTGIGIPKKFHEKIFERFVQVKDKKTFSIPGTGLGLAICLNLAEMLNGEVKLLDSSIKGTSFSLTIPYYPSSK